MIWRREGIRTLKIKEAYIAMAMWEDLGREFLLWRHGYRTTLVEVCPADYGEVGIKKVARS